MRNAMRLIVRIGCYLLCFCLCLGAARQASAAEKISAEVASKGALQVGDKAKDGELLDAAGNKVTLSGLWKEQPVVLIWYRGGWCPICMRHLTGIQAELPKFVDAGVKVVAIAPEQPEFTKETAEARKLDFLLLSDKGNKVGKEYGVVFDLDDATARRYEGRFHLAQVNGDQSYQLPFPAAYVINQEGVITFAYVEPDYSVRVKASDLLKAVDKLKAKPSRTAAAQ